MGRFKKGVFLGSLVGAGLVWLNATKKGKEVREKILEYATDVYAEVKEKVTSSPKWANLKKNEYVILVREVVDRYAGRFGLSDQVKTTIAKIVANQWENLKKEIEGGGKKLKK